MSDKCTGHASSAGEITSSDLEMALWERFSVTWDAQARAQYYAAVRINVNVSCWQYISSSCWESNIPDLMSMLLSLMRLSVSPENHVDIICHHPCKSQIILLQPAEQHPLTLLAFKAIPCTL